MTQTDQIKKMIRIVEEDLDAVHYEMKELDKKWIEKQRESRELKKTKENLESMLKQSTDNWQAKSTNVAAAIQKKPDPPDIRTVREGFSLTEA